MRKGERNFIMRFEPRHRKSLFVAAFFALTGLLAGAIGAAERPGPADSPAADTMSMQKEIVSMLSGQSEIRSGVRLANRSAIENRKEARDYLEALLRRLGLSPRRQAYGTEGENIFALIACGKPSAEAIVFGAHYDSARNSPGANDDATGVAAVAGIAREVSRLKKRTRDVIIVFFDEEERGLRGSRAFAQLLSDEKRAIHSVHTIDQMGWDKDGDRAIELELPYPGAEETYRKADEALKNRIPILITPEAGSDHSAFRRLGYKAIGITEEYRNKDTTPFIHRPGDVYDTVDFDYLASTTRLLVEVARILTR